MILKPTWEDFRTLAALAVPVTLVQVGMMAMNVVDIMMVGHLSPTALAGVAMGSVYIFAFGTFTMGLVMAMDPLVSQAFGAGDQDAIARAFQRGVVMAAILGTIGGLALYPVDRVLRALGQPESLIAVATPYARAQMPAMIPFALFLALRVTLQAQSLMRPVVITIVIANLVNATLVYGLVYGHFGIPALGAWGAGVATSIARWFMVALLLTLAWSRLRPWMRWRADSIQRAPMLRMFLIGLPIGLQFELEYGVFAAVALLMGRLGAVPASAHQIAINIASLTFMMPLGVSTAASVLVGRAVGAGDPVAARRAAVAALLTGAGVMALSAGVLVSVPRLLAHAYSPDAAVIAMAAVLIPIAGVFQVFDGIQVVSIGVLRGAGDTRTPLIVNLIGYWLLALPIALWLGLGLGLGPQGLWWGLVAGLVVVALILLVRVRVRLWRTLERLDIEDRRPTTQGAPLGG